MPEFHMIGKDESGFLALDSFAQGYIEALFFTEQEPGTSREERVTKSGNVRKEWAKRVSDGYQKDMPGDYGFDDLAPETLEQIKADCALFQALHKTLLDRAYANKAAYGPTRAGADFWYTRNGHGVGFWDRDLGDEIGDTLSALCGWESRNLPNPFGERDAYIGDDQKVYLG